MSKRQAAAPRPNVQAVFESWAQHRMDAPEAALSPRSVAKYRSVWNAWARLLGERQTTWHRATPELIAAFVAQIQPRAHGQARPSHVSRRRYWRILNHVYGHALSRGWLRANPATQASGEVPRSETSAAVVLPPAYLQALRERLHRAAAAPPPTWQTLRDQALLAVLLDAALTTAELCALRNDQVLPHAPSGSLVLRIDGQRPAQRRDLLLAPATAALLARWRSARQALYPEPEQRPAVLFVSQKRPGQLTPKSVFLLLQAQIAALEQQQQSLIGHRGANVIRSSVIAEWLHQGIAASDVIARAGLDSDRALQRLAHATPRRTAAASGTAAFAA